MKGPKIQFLNKFNISRSVSLLIFKIIVFNNAFVERSSHCRWFSRRNLPFECGKPHLKYFKRVEKAKINAHNTTEMVSESINYFESDPFHSLTKYNDSLGQRILISLFAHKFNQTVGQSLEAEGYKSIVENSFNILKSKNLRRQRDVISEFLNCLIPSFIQASFRTVFSNDKWACQLTAAFVPVFSEWMVGRSSIIAGVVERKDGTKEEWRSTVRIERCRFLEQSACKGSCINLCKLPTQTFFAQKLGMPLYMKPNFTDLSCDMVFGQIPPDIEADPVQNQACFSQCQLSDKLIQFQECPKIPKDAG